MEHTSDIVAEGKLIHETSYLQRPGKYSEISIGGSKIDYYDAVNKIIHEVKKTDSMEAAHEWQVKYYIWLLSRNGIEGARGVLEYPKLREIKDVALAEEDENHLEDIVKKIEQIIDSERCPSRLDCKFCKKCSYYDFCYSSE
ncbi:CRISPR-associated protein Cas4 [Flavitalea flava]